MTPAQALALIEARFEAAPAGCADAPAAVGLVLVEAGQVADALRCAIDATVYAPRPEPHTAR